MPPTEYTGYILVSLTSFLFGVGIGWLASSQAHSLGEKEVRTLIAFILIVTYVVSIFAEIMVSGYNTPMLFHAVIGGVVGYLFSFDNEDGFNIQIGGGQ